MEEQDGTPKVDLKKAEELLMDNPVALWVAIGLLTFEFLSSESTRPAWLKNCAPVHGRRAGPWRGKGSFGRGFGPNRVKHK